MCGLSNLSGIVAGFVIDLRGLEGLGRFKRWAGVPPTPAASNGKGLGRLCGRTYSEIGIRWILDGLIMEGRLVNYMGLEELGAVRSVAVRCECMAGTLAV